MNKRNKQIVPLCFLIAIVIFAVILFLVCKPKIDEYQEIQIRSAKNKIEREDLEARIQKIEDAEKEEKLKLQSLKPIYESPASNTSNENLGIFGNMFEDIINIAQKNGLLIRSIEYDMRPAEDPIYIESPDLYNVCELKFFFVGSYSQLQSFFSDINKEISYLTYISNLNITAFTENTDYLLINTSITLYSKKPEQEISKKRTRQSRNK